MIHTVNHHTAYSYSKFTCRAPNLVKIKSKNPLGLNSADQDDKTPRLTELQSCKSQISAGQKQTSSTSAVHGHHNGQEYNFFKAKPLLCWRSDLAFFNLRYYFLNCFKALHLCWNASRNNKRIAFVGANGNLLDMADLASYGHDFKNKGLTRDVLPRLKGTFLQPLQKTKASIGNRFKSNKTARAMPKIIPQKVHGTLKPRQAYGLAPLRLLSKYLQACPDHNSNFKKHSRYDARPPAGEKSYQSQIQNKIHYRLQGKLGLAGARRPALLYNDTSTGFFSNPELSCPSLWNHFLALVHKNTPQIRRNVAGKHVFGFQTYNLRFPLDGIVPNVGETYVLKRPSPGSQSRKTLFERGGGKKKTNVYISPRYRNLCVQALFKLCFGSSSAPKTKGIAARIKIQNKKQSKQTQCLKFLFTKRHARTKPGSNSLGSIGHTVHNNKRNTPYVIRPSLRGSHLGSKIYKARPRLQRSQKWSLYAPKGVVSNIVYSRHFYKRYIAPRRNFKKRKYHASFLRVSYGHDFKKFATNSNLKQADAIFFTHPDKTAALTSQARRLRLPTIGLVSGLKHNQHNIQKDSVDYPILGNPNNSFFVFMVLRMFLNVIHHAPMLRRKNVKATPALRAKVALTPRADTKRITTFKAGQAPGPRFKGSFATKAGQPGPKTNPGQRFPNQGRRGPAPEGPNGRNSIKNTDVHFGKKPFVRPAAHSGIKQDPVNTYPARPWKK